MIDKIQEDIILGYLLNKIIDAVAYAVLKLGFSPVKENKIVYNLIDKL